MNNYTFFLSSSGGTTGSTYTVTGEKGGGVIKNNGVVIGAEGESVESEVVQPEVDNTSNEQSDTNAEVAVPTDDVSTQSSTTGGLFSIFAMYGVFIAIFYFLVLKPQRKRQKMADELVQSLKVGDEVLTSSGYYGKICDIGEDVCFVEFGTNRAIRIPVDKREIIKKEKPEY